METFLPSMFSNERIIDGVLHNLTFKKVWSTHGEKYFVLVLQNGQNIGSFEIVKRHGAKWTVVPPAPVWFLFNEEKIGFMIEANASA